MGTERFLKSPVWFLLNTLPVSSLLPEERAEDEYCVMFAVAHRRHPTPSTRLQKSLLADVLLQKSELIQTLSIVAKNMEHVKSLFSGKICSNLHDNP